MIDTQINYNKACRLHEIHFSTTFKVRLKLDKHTRSPRDINSNNHTLLSSHEQIKIYICNSSRGICRKHSDGQSKHSKTQNVHVQKTPNKDQTQCRPFVTPSVFSKYSTKSSMVHTLIPHFFPNRKHPSRLIIPFSPRISATPSTISPSSTSSAITPAGAFPASRQNSTAASVCPLRSRTPPGRACSGMMWPGRRRESMRAPEDASVRQVRARSWAEIPVVTEASLESIVIV